MSTPQATFYVKYGNPLKDKLSFEKKWMEVYKYPKDILDNIPSLGNSIYCNKDFTPIYQQFLLLLIMRGLHNEIKTNDECFNVRAIRGIPDFLSIHSWGMAVDLNTNHNHNPLGLTRQQAIDKGLTPFTPYFIKTAEDIGLIAGYNFSRCDGMHFENTKGLYNKNL